MAKHQTPRTHHATAIIGSAKAAYRTAKTIKNAINAFSNKDTDTRGETTPYHDSSVLYKKRKRSTKSLKKAKKLHKFKLKIEKALRVDAGFNALTEQNSTVQTVTSPAGGQVGVQYIWPSSTNHCGS